MKYKVLDSIKNQEENALKEQFALDVLTGLTREQKTLSSKYLYDDLGSDLFVKITQLEEYYPTDAEKEIFEKQKSKIVSRIETKDLNIIELGAGDGHKTKILIREFLKNKFKLKFTPIDISENAIQGLVEDFSKEFPSLENSGVVGEYQEAMKWASKNQKGPKLVLLLGSNLGNFSLRDSLVFLRMIWKDLEHGDYLLTGFDLKKDINLLLHAYNDSLGITSAFNLNLLTRINNELGGNFDIKNFQHFGTYNPILGAMESYLISLKEQTVRIDYLEKEFKFDEFESVHLEYSFKYLDKDIEYLAQETGFEIVESFRDSKALFVDSLWKVVKD